MKKIIAVVAIIIIASIISLTFFITPKRKLKVKLYINDDLSVSIENIGDKMLPRLRVEISPHGGDIRVRHTIDSDLMPKQKDSVSFDIFGI